MLIGVIKDPVFLVSQAQEKDFRGAALQDADGTEPSPRHWLSKCRVAGGTPNNIYYMEESCSFQG